MHIKYLLTGFIVVNSVFAQHTEYQYVDFNPGKNVGNEEWIQSIQIIEPSCRSDVNGIFTVKFKASGMTEAKVMYWSQSTDEFPDRWGHDVNLTPKGVKLDTASLSSTKKAKSLN